MVGKDRQASSEPEEAASHKYHTKDSCVPHRLKPRARAPPQALLQSHLPGEVFGDNHGEAECGRWGALGLAGSSLPH